jgi:hypothetical protein
MVGTGGIVGTGGSSGTTCATLEQDYLTELTAAKVCNIASLINPCTVEVLSTLSCEGACTTFVVDASKLTAIEADWQNMGCRTPVCPNGCRNPPTGGSCVGILAATTANSSASSAAVAPPIQAAHCQDVTGGPLPAQ